MADGSSSRERKVRGTKIRTDRSEKRLRRATKEADRRSTSREDDAELMSPADARPDPFVETDEIETLERRIDGWFAADRPIHLIGPTGCGKTALALHAASRRDRPVVWINGDEAVDTAALVGEHAGGERYRERDEYVSGVRKETEIVREGWVDNALTVAAREGATLVYNEFSRSDPSAHNVFLSVLEEGVMERAGKRGDDRQFEVHPEFRLLVTSNTAEYAGVYRQQDALLDRFVGIHVDYYDAETEREIVAAHVDLDADRIDQVVDATHALREELELTIGTRVAITAAEGLAVFGERAREGDADDAASAEETTGEGEAATDEDGESADESGEATDETATRADIDRERLLDVFTDVLAPKVAGDGDVTELRDRIEKTL